MARIWIWAIVSLALGGAAQAEDVKVLTSGAFKQIVASVAPAFERETGHRLVVQNDTAGGIARKVEAGESFDLVVVPPAQMKPLAEAGRVAAASVRPLAKVGVGVAVRTGAPHPAIGSVDAFRATLLAASRIAYIDPASGGSSGIYFAGLAERLGIAEAVRGKSVLVKGGLVADRIADGSADLAVQQISELVGFAGVDLVGPLPAEIQSYTTYAGALPPNAPDKAAALLSYLAGPSGRAALAARGMEAP